MLGVFGTGTRRVRCLAVMGLLCTTVEASGSQFPNDTCTAWQNCIDSCSVSKNGRWDDDTIAALGSWGSYANHANAAISIMNRYPGVISTDATFLHTTIQYLCCYDLLTYEKFVSVISNSVWQPINITFGQAVCNSDAGANNHTSIIVLYDEPSQQAMSALVGRFESALVAAGIPIPQPRSGN